ncbi:MAG: type IV toxin-antitoxin system AbiEi family antitoxin [Anaerovoracaceae bacterium]
MKYQKEISLIKKIFLEIPVVESLVVIKSKESIIYCNAVFHDGEALEITAIVMIDAEPARISKVLAEKEKDRIGYTIIVAPYISEASNQLCKDKNVGFVDESGNVLLKFENVFFNKTGNSNKHKKKRRTKSIFENSSIVSSIILRTIFADISKPWKLKYLAEEVGCSIGQISKIKEFLVFNDWVDLGDDGMVIKNAKEILLQWANVYRINNENIQEYYSLDDAATIEAKLRKLKKNSNVEYYLTGFSGGVRYSPSVRYDKVHLYIPFEQQEKAINQLELKKVDTGSNISIVTPYDECVLFDKREIKGDSVVSPVQAYLDCMQFAGRGEELAEQIMKKEILK